MSLIANPSACVIMNLSISISLNVSLSWSMIRYKYQCAYEFIDESGWE